MGTAILKMGERYPDSRWPTLRQIVDATNCWDFSQSLTDSGHMKRSASSFRREAGVRSRNVRLGEIDDHMELGHRQHGR